jgi:hypothetical protein
MLHQNFTIGSLAQPSMLTKMAKTPTYTQKQQQQQKQDVALKNCICMASDSLPMQTQDDRAPMTDAIRFRIVLLQVSRRELVLCQTFLLWRS